jgi:hypothetical protein
MADVIAIRAVHASAGRAIGLMGVANSGAATATKGYGSLAARSNVRSASCMPHWKLTPALGVNFECHWTSCGAEFLAGIRLTIAILF